MLSSSDAARTSAVGDGGTTNHPRASRSSNSASVAAPTGAVLGTSGGTLVGAPRGVPAPIRPSVGGAHRATAREATVVAPAGATAASTVTVASTAAWAGPLGDTPHRGDLTAAPHRGDLIAAPHPRTQRGLGVPLSTDAGDGGLSAARHLWESGEARR